MQKSKGELRCLAAWPQNPSSSPGQLEQLQPVTFPCAMSGELLLQRRRPDYNSRMTGSEAIILTLSVLHGKPLRQSLLQFGSELRTLLTEFALALLTALPIALLIALSIA